LFVWGVVTVMVVSMGGVDGEKNKGGGGGGGGNKNEESEVTDVLFRAFLATTKKNHTEPLTIVGATA